MMKFFSQETKNIASAATIVAAFSFISRFVGFIRDRILAGHFGAGPVLDSYYAAFLVPDLLFSLLVVGALSASFIPLFTKHYKNLLSKERAWDLVNNMINILAVSLAVVSIALFFLAPQIAHLIAPTFTGEKMHMVVVFTRIMFISDFLLALSAVYGSALQGMKRFLVYSLSPILYNLGIIFGAVVLTPMIGYAGLAWGVVIGAFLHFCLQYFGVRAAGYRWRWFLNLKDKETHEIGRLMIPRTMGVAVGQLDDAILIMIATTLAAGSVTIYQFAYNIQFFVVGIIGVSFAVAAFPSLSESAANNDTDHFTATLSETTRQMLFFIIPSSIIFLLLRAQIVRVVVGAGKFGWTETIQTADTLAFFTLSFFAQGLVYLLARAFYAHRDTITPFVVGIVNALFTVIAALLFTREFGVVGLSMAFSLAALVNVSILWIALRLKVGSLREGEIIRSLFKISIAAIVCGVVTQAMKALVVQYITIDTFIGVLAQGLIAGGLGLAVYGIVAWYLKSPEMISFLASMRKKFFKSFQPTEIVSSDQPTV